MYIERAWSLTLEHVGFFDKVLQHLKANGVITADDLKELIEIEKPKS